MSGPPATELPALPTLVDLCRHRAAEQAGREMFVFLANGVDQTGSLSLGELDRRARAVAVRLRQLAPAGARALLSYPPGLEFVTAFFGCLYAGLVAVPVPQVARAPADPRHRRVSAVAASCTPELLLSTAAALDRAAPVLRDAPALRGLGTLATDEVAAADAERWEPPAAGPDTVAYLQYTSGTTGPPKGVVLTHGNVLHNLALIVANGARQGEDLSRVPPMVSWLPVFHDMGLVSGVIQPLYVGFDAVLIPPAVFAQDPFVWLRAISDRGEANTAAPGFGYELCLARIGEEQRRTLDLSGLRVAVIGDEPVRAATIDAFSAAFAPSGFRREAFFPSYGMAESTVMVSGGPAGRGPVVRRFDAAALAKGKVQPAGSDAEGRRMVGCGQIQPSLTVAVVDPATGEPCAPDEVGEVLVSGPSIGTAYWDAPEETARTLRARVPGHGDREFLRLGSLGFRYDDQLFITCRVADLIVLDGVQHYPYDLEETAWRSHPAVRPGYTCAFTVGDGRHLVILAETASRYRVLADARAAGDAAGAGRTGRAPVWAGEVQRAVRAAVGARHGVTVHDVVLLKAGTLPFTTSNKLQRSECRTAYLARAFTQE